MRGKVLQRVALGLCGLGLLGGGLTAGVALAQSGPTVTAQQAGGNKIIIPGIAADSASGSSGSASPSATSTSTSPSPSSSASPTSTGTSVPPGGGVPGLPPGGFAAPAIAPAAVAD